jgi:hypothetical protein
MGSWILRHLATLQGRIATGVLAIFAAVGFAQPGGPWTFHWEALTTLLAAFGAWIVAEVQGAASPFPHDIALLQKIADTIPEYQRDFLRGHDFWDSFNRSSLHGFTEITYWDGAAGTFLDREMQKRWVPLKTQAEAMRDLVAGTTVPDPFAGQMQTVHPSQGDREQPNDTTRSEIRALNETAKSLMKLLDEFELYGRRRFRV